MLIDSGAGNDKT